MINHRSSWAAAAVVCRCGNRFLCPLCSLQVARGRNLSHSPAAAGVKSFAGVSWNAAHRGVTRNITERFPAGRVITVMRLSPWRRPGVTGDSQDRWRMPSAMEITAGKTAVTFRRSDLVFFPWHIKCRRANSTAMFTSPLRSVSWWVKVKKKNVVVCLLNYYSFSGAFVIFLFCSPLLYLV